MNKKYWHYIWTTYIRPVKLWYLLVLCFLSGVVCVFALRSNNQHMGKLREAVYTADKNNTDVVGALQKLQTYVNSHMNTSLATGNTSVYPPIQLKYTYQRLQDAAQEKAATSNTALYSEAQKYCEQQDSTDFSGRNRIPCIEEYVTAHGGTTAQKIPDSMYKFDFASPTWSPDLAGWSLVLAGLFDVLFVLRVALGLLIKRLAR
jgi:hypothetical protein